MENKREIGNAGENVVCAFLEQNGYTILARNYTVRGGEIDIIAEKNDMIAFVEVKLRKEGALVSGEEAVNGQKKKHIILAAERYMLTAKPDKCARFDVASVEVKKNGKLRLKYYVSAFDASK
ncbi:MAG: YraN family protein [Ruminococcus sp.]|nr:YraN family protein [Ruminococcus sp.]